MSSAADHPVRLRRALVPLWRSPGVLQLGVEPTVITIQPVPAGLARVVEQLSEPHTVSQLAAKNPGISSDWIDWICAYLGSAGLLLRGPSAPRRAVDLWGTGSLAERVSAGLNEAGLPHRRVGHTVPDIAEDGRLVVLADRRCEADRAAVARLTAEGISHLVVRVEHGRAVVGPFVAPGRTPCLRCDDLARAAADHAWPLLLAQLCATESRADAGLISWAAAIAVAQVRAWSCGVEPETAGRLLELAAADFRLHARSWPFQASCGCVPGPTPMPTPGDDATASRGSDAGGRLSR